MAENVLQEIMLKSPCQFLHSKYQLTDHHKLSPAAAAAAAACQKQWQALEISLCCNAAVVWHEF